MEPVTHIDWAHLRIRPANPHSVPYTLWRVHLSQRQRDALIVSAVAHAAEHAAEDPVPTMWRFIRANCPWVRARDPYCAVNLNTARRRNFRAPLGELLGLNDTIGYGQYCCRYPRTRRSEQEEERIVRLVSDHVIGLVHAWNAIQRGFCMFDGRRYAPEWDRGCYRWSGTDELVRYAHLLLAVNYSWPKDVAYRLGLNPDEVLG